MASSLRRIGSQSSTGYRFVLPQLTSRFSTDALSVEYKAGEIGTVSGIPDEHLQRRVLIYSPARTASQQGAGKVGKWKINFMSTQKWENENPLMGWTSTGDPSISRHLCTATGTQTQKLERIADEILSLTKLERNDYTVLLRYKMGFNNYGPAVTGIGSPLAGGAAAAGPGSDAKAAEKVVFDVKLEKYDAATKIKIIKEVRAFTDLGLKEAKDLVEKVPVVVKKGITKDDAEAIMSKLKDLGATVVLE